MTQRNLLELLIEAAPQKGEAYLRILSNEALKEYAEETRALEGTASITTVSDQSHYALPADCVEVLEVFDADGHAVSHGATYSFHLHPSGSALWWVENEGGQEKLLLGAVKGAELVTLEGGREYTLRYVRYAQSLSGANMDSDIDLPGSLQGAIECRVMERLLSTRPEERAYWYARWRDYVRRGKQYGNRAKDGASYNVIINEL